LLLLIYLFKSSCLYALLPPFLLPASLQVTVELKLGLPQVAVVGSQSSGKSSVLEALVSSSIDASAAANATEVQSTSNCLACTAAARAACWRHW
jgi:predicted ATPase